MKKEIQEAVDYMISTYDSLQSAARGFSYLNFNDVQSELKKAKADTAEYVALSVLAASLQPSSVIESAPEVTE